ncbi:MAG: hypothetical protein K6F46_05860, partial [Desulfovibrio sp.]|nr:hypothetical protein [Desulfovibrio sp.]
SIFGGSPLSRVLLERMVAGGGGSSAVREAVAQEADRLAAEIRDAAGLPRDGKAGAGAEADAGALREEVRRSFEGCLEAIRSLAAIHRLSSGRNGPDHLEESVKRLGDTVDAALNNDRLPPEALRRMTAILAEAGSRLAELAEKAKAADGKRSFLAKRPGAEKAAEAGGGKPAVAAKQSQAEGKTPEADNKKTVAGEEKPAAVEGRGPSDRGKAPEVDNKKTGAGEEKPSAAEGKGPSDGGKTPEAGGGKPVIAAKRDRADRKNDAAKCAVVGDFFAKYRWRGSMRLPTFRDIDVLITRDEDEGTYGYRIVRTGFEGEYEWDFRMLSDHEILIGEGSGFSQKGVRMAAWRAYSDYVGNFSTPEKARRWLEESVKYAHLMPSLVRGYVLKDFDHVVDESFWKGRDFVKIDERAAFSAAPPPVQADAEDPAPAEPPAAMAM